MEETVLLFPPANEGAEFASFDDRDPGEFIPSFVFDATLSEDTALEIEWTSHPTERDGVISDHGIVGQEVATFTGEVSRTTLAKNPQYANDPGRLDLAINDLFAMGRAKNRVTVFTPTRVYQDFRVSSVNMTRSADSGQSAAFTIGIVEIRTVDSASVEIPPTLIKPEKRNKATKEQSAGSQTATQTTATNEAGPNTSEDGGSERSWGAGAVDYFTGN